MTEKEFVSEMIERGYTKKEAFEEIKFWKDGGKLLPLEKNLMPEKPKY
ncbi:MAG: hypothetical protein IKJ44_00720 [Elusimicrobiaceae bacterium]|nr:hypothetical protein [Elusimicrobiaceae bacterium]